MMITTLFPATFPALALAHFVALISPGQDFFLIVAHSIRHKLRGSFYICIGIAVGNAIYIAITIVGWTSIRDNPTLFLIVESLGAIYLVWIGTRLLKSNRNDDLLKAEEDLIPSAMKQLLLGLNSALLNPKNALFYMSLMAVILGSEVTLIQQISCAVWMFFAVLVYGLLIASMVGQAKIQKHLKRHIHLVERGAGIILVGLGSALFIL